MTGTLTPVKEPHMLNSEVQETFATFTKKQQGPRNVPLGSFKVNKWVVNVKWNLVWHVLFSYICDILPSLSQPELSAFF